MKKLAMNLSHNGSESDPIARDLQVLQWVILLFAFCIPLTISLAEPLGFLSLAVFAATLRHRAVRAAFMQNPLLIPMGVFVFVAIIISLGWGVRPERSASKFHRLLLLMSCFALQASVVCNGNAASTRRNLYRLVVAYLAGCTVLGGYDLVRVPLHALRGGDIYDAGNMRDPQFFLVGLSFLLAMWAAGAHFVRGARYWWWVALILQGAGLVLHFKRGVWISLVAVVVLLVLRTRRWRLLLALAGCALLLLLLPQVRTRLIRLHEVREVRTGGRLVLWTETAPSLYAAYPMGMGWCAVTQDDFSAHSSHVVQKKLNHLHNNFMQIRLELGWMGVLCWSGLIGMVLLLYARSGGGWNAGACEQQCAETRWMTLGGGGAFFGLLVNGMVEYNFGDTEILMLYSFLIGCCSVLWFLKKGETE